MRTTQMARSKLWALAGLVLSVLLNACAGPSAPQRNERLAKAKAMFEQRCQTAGEKIHRTVDNVEGIFLLKLRPEEINFGNQFALDDPYGHDLIGATGYITSFVRGSYQANTKGTPAPGSPPRLGYLFVEAADPSDGKRYRYTGEVREYEATSSIMMGGDGKKFKRTGFVLDKLPAPGAAPRYGVTHDDISTREEREYWIAGSSLRVIDLLTNEVLAERVGYMIDLAQGSTARGRSPWLLAADNACPSFFRNPQLPHRGPAFAVQARQAQDFVEKVLKPKGE